MRDSKRHSFQRTIIVKSNYKNNPDLDDNRLFSLVAAHISTSECYISLERYNYDESTRIIVETLCKYPDIQMHLRKIVSM